MSTTVQNEVSAPVVSRPMGARDLMKSVGLHSLVLGIVAFLPAGALRQSAEPEEVEVVFHPPVPTEMPPPALPPAPRGPAIADGPPAPHASTRPAPSKPSVPGEPLAAPTPGLPEGPEEIPIAEAPAPKPGKSGILAFKDQFASIATDKTAPRLGADARYSAADDVGQGSSVALLAGNGPGSSGGIDSVALTRSVGGGGGGGTGGGSPRPGVAVGRAQSSIAGIGGGSGSRGLGNGGSGDSGTGRGGPGMSRTDEEIQIVFDRNKASFYRLYHVELRKDPTLRGQLVLRLTIEPDGRVSMCTLQASDMHAPELAAQVVDRVKTINFGAKEGVSALTIVYPIDFLPAA